MPDLNVIITSVLKRYYFWT